MRISLRNRLLAAAATGSALFGLAAGPATAADTTTTFTLTSGGLAVSAPASKTLSAGTTIGTAGLSGALGTVTVSDLRGQLLLGWTATAATSTFVTDDSGPSEVISKASISYWSGAATLTSGVAVPAGQQLSSANKVALDVARSAVVVPVTTGSAVVTWTPTVEIAVPANVVAGTYTGTITHSVA